MTQLLGSIPKTPEKRRRLFQHTRVEALTVLAWPGGRASADAGGTWYRVRAFSPLGAGFLTGKIDENTKFDPTDFRNIVPRFSPEARKANTVLVDLVKAFAERKGATPAQVVLAWLLAQKS